MTEEELYLLREWIQEPVSEEWNDDRLNQMYALLGNDLEQTAAAFWRSKISSAATLVDVSENGSSRKLSDIHRNYGLILADFERRIAERDVTTGRPYTVGITRP